MEVTFRLMQESGVQGPQTTVEVEPTTGFNKKICKQAREWADGQTGHPWDFLTVEFDGQMLDANEY